MCSSDLTERESARARAREREKARARECIQNTERERSKRDTKRETVAKQILERFANFLRAGTFNLLENN